MTTNIQLGKTYKVVSQRKGTVTGTVITADDTWVTLLITKGKAQALMSYNERKTGEEVTVRQSLTKFTLQEAEAS
jgi:hypothetical protein